MALGCCNSRFQLRWTREKQKHFRQENGDRMVGVVRKYIIWSSYIPGRKRKVIKNRKALQCYRRSCIRLAIIEMGRWVCRMAVTMLFCYGGKKSRKETRMLMTRRRWEESAHPPNSIHTAWCLF